LAASTVTDRPKARCETINATPSLPEYTLQPASQANKQQSPVSERLCISPRSTHHTHTHTR
jgi:hypothetical protein